MVPMFVLVLNTEGKLHFKCPLTLIRKCNFWYPGDHPECNFWCPGDHPKVTLFNDEFIFLFLFILSALGLWLWMGNVTFGAQGGTQKLHL